MRRLLLIMLSVLLISSQLLAQNRTVSGRVTDDKGNPIPNASVIVKGTAIGTTADASGRYTISVPGNATTLVISAVDAGQIEVSIGNQTTINPVLRAGDRTLGEVVVTGYTTRRRTEFTGASNKVQAKAIEQVPLASFEQILQGRAPGLYIASGSGQPGTAARVNIRGVGSISGSSTPLYVLDGIPIEPQVFRSLNPNDFESVDVLKDAAGAGQYGSRGANGVIVITTKKGRAGARTQLQARAQTGFSQPPQQLNLRLMNTDERLRFEESVLGGPAGILSATALTGFPGWDYSPNNPRYQTLTATQRAAEALLLDSIRKINTDWPSIFFQNGKFSQYEVNASGGSQNLSFYTSLSYYKQEGIVIGSKLDRYTFRANIDFKQDRLTVGIRSGAGYSSSKGIESEAGVALANPIAAAYLELPYRRLYLGNGAVDTAAGKTGPNAYDRIFTTDNRSNQFKGNLGLTLQFELWKGIAIRSTNGIDYRNNNQSRFINPNSFLGGQQQGPSGSRGQGAYGEGNFENVQLTTTSGLVFSRTFNSKHVVNAQAMIEAIRSRQRAFSVTGFGINPALPNTPAGITSGTATNGFIPAFGGAFLPGNGKTVTGLYSQFLLADYTYNRKYTISGSIRNDAPSQVPAKNRTNIFWTAGASWNVSAEDFMAKQNIFQDVRFRASYGETANVAGFNSDFGYISTYGPSGAGYAGLPAIVPTSPGNLDYRLESQVITNVGLEFAMWNRRVRAGVDFYVKDSRNLFVNQNLSRITGFRSLSTNAGTMRNKGVEFSLNVDAVATPDFLVSVGVNGAFNKNTIRSLGGLTEIPQGTGIIRVGESLGTHFTVGYLGVDPQSGLPVYEDINGNPTTNFNAANNRAAYGTFLPSFTGGATLDISWKGFSVSALFSTAQGVKRYNNESFFYETTNSNTTFNKRVDLLTNTWLKPGDQASYQRINSVRQFSSRDIQDASFIRFRNLQIGYTYKPKNDRYIKGVRLWAQGQNLYTWTKWQGFDPEESNNIATYEFPNPRTYTVGLDVNF